MLPKFSQIVSGTLDCRLKELKFKEASGPAPLVGSIGAMRSHRLNEV